MVINRQKHVTLDLTAVRTFVRRLRRMMRLGRRDFTVCFGDDKGIKGLNAAFRGRPRPTDVLSFPWREVGQGSPPSRMNRDRSAVQAAIVRSFRGLPYRPRANHSAGKDVPSGEFKDFLGDVMISVETARRNARAEGHSTQTEIRRLVLHGLLHLLGYDHERDDGEMIALERSLRMKLGVANQLRIRGKSKGKK